MHEICRMARPSGAVSTSTHASSLTRAAACWEYLGKEFGAWTGLMHSGGGPHPTPRLTAQSDVETELDHVAARRNISADVSAEYPTM